MNGIRPVGIPAPHPPAGARPSSQPGTEEPAATRPGASTFLELLTPEEREFFAQLSTMGKLTYRPGGNDTPAGPTGQRIDVRG